MNTIKNQKTSPGFLLHNNKTDKMPDTPSDNNENLLPIISLYGNCSRIKNLFAESKNST